MQREVNEKPVYAIAAAVQLPNVSDIEFEASLSELRELAKTLGFTVVRTFIQKRNGFDTTAYLGVGKRQEIHHYVNHEAECEIEAILVDHEISPSQARNLEKEVGCEVMDRTMVILEIFHRNARSRAARAQVEIARLGYMAPRLREAAKLAGPQGRQRSGVGGRGAGESATEMDRRKIRDRIAELQLEIVAMEAERKTQRARRQERQGLASVALVGYTNAGKSTLMRALTGSEVLVANKLFATLDTTVRVLHPESVPRVLVSDTVGFIKNLPHGLVASFKSTLDEALVPPPSAHVHGRHVVEHTVGHELLEVCEHRRDVRITKICSGGQARRTGASCTPACTPTGRSGTPSASSASAPTSPASGTSPPASWPSTWTSPARSSSATAPRWSAARFCSSASRTPALS